MIRFSIDNKKELLKTDLRALFLAIIIIVAIFLCFNFNVANADENLDYFYRIDFSDYDLGSVHDQYDWQTSIISGQKAEIIDVGIIAPNNVLYIWGFATKSAFKYFGGNIINHDKMEMRLFDLVMIIGENNYITLGEDSFKPFARVNFVRNAISGVDVFLKSGTGEHLIDNIDTLDLKLIIEFKTFGLPPEKTSLYQVKVGENWSGWYSLIDNNVAENLDRLGFNFSSNIKIDDIFFTGRQCDFEHCELCGTALDCENAGCYYNWNLGVCGIETFGICGENENLAFCDNEIDCLGNSGFWVNDFCWENEPETSIDFLEYYQDNSEHFDTPTPFFSNLANFFTPIYQTLSGFLITFDTHFSKASASEYGTMTGTAIASAKNSIGLINDFFGGLPIAEALFIFLVFSILIVVVRLVFKLVNLIKP